MNHSSAVGRFLHWRCSARCSCQPTVRLSGSRAPAATHRGRQGSISSGASFRTWPSVNRVSGKAAEELQSRRRQRTRPVASLGKSAEITGLLKAWGRGDSAALDRLTPLVYEQLRRMARSYMRNERPGHTLQATALVNEAFLRLVDT